MPVCGGKAPFYTLLSVCSRHTTRHLFSSPEVPGTTLFHYVVPLGVIHPCHLRVLRRISGQGSLGSGGNLADKTHRRQRQHPGRRVSTLPHAPGNDWSKGTPSVSVTIQTPDPLHFCGHMQILGAGQGPVKELSKLCPGMGHGARELIKNYFQIRERSPENNSG